MGLSFSPVAQAELKKDSPQLHMHSPIPDSCSFVVQLKEKQRQLSCQILEFAKALPRDPKVVIEHHGKYNSMLLNIST